MAVEARVVASLQSSQGSRVPVAVGVYNGELIVVCPGGQGETKISSKSSLAVHRVYNPTKEPIVLYGHHSNINTVALSSFCSATPSSSRSASRLSSDAPPTFLCSASSDSVLLWILEHCFDQYNTDGHCPYNKLPCPPGREAPVCHVAFSPNAQFVVLCRGAEALVYSTETCELDTTLVGHSAPVTCAVFSPHNLHEVVTVSEDRTFKIWDLSCSSLLYQSAVISASAFLCASVALHGAYLATGTADGVIRIYDLAKQQAFKCLHKFDVANEIEKWSTNSPEYITSGGALICSHPQQQCSSVGVTPSATIETGTAILGLFYWPQSPTEDERSPTSEVLQSCPVLLTVTHLGLLAFNAQTMEVMSVVNFRDTLPSVGGTSCSIPTTATCSFSFNPITNEVLCALGAMFSSSVSALVLVDTQCHHQQQELESEYQSASCAAVSETVSVLSSAPLVINSPLSAEFSFKTKSTPAGAGKNIKTSRSSRSQPSSLNQPLTFKSKVKSSGYSETPRTKMFAAKTGFQKGSSSSPRNSKVSELKKQEYPMTCGPVSHLSHSMTLTDRPTAIHSAIFSGNGQYLACACADKAAYTVKKPPSSGRVHAFVGHNGAVLSACWNHSGQWLLTCSTDKTAKVWSSAHKDPLLTINTVRHNLTTPTSKESKANIVFTKEISKAQFYYLDKFLLLTSGNGLYLYKYYIDTAKPDDIKRYLTDSRYKILNTLLMESAQTITAMSTINDFHSYIVLVAGSNKAIEVFDMNVGSSIRTMADVHTRAVHCIHQNNGSRYTSLPQSAYDIFLTSAVTDGIKLWDLRTNSPCARFIATGSEDRAVYIYDIRYPSPLHKLTGHSDVVSTVIYHPLKPMVGVTTMDGKVSFWSEERLR